MSPFAREAMVLGESKSDANPRSVRVGTRPEATPQLLGKESGLQSACHVINCHWIFYWTAKSCVRPRSRQRGNLWFAPLPSQPREFLAYEVSPSVYLIPHCFSLLNSFASSSSLALGTVVIFFISQRLHLSLFFQSYQAEAE